MALATVALNGGITGQFQIGRFTVQAGQTYTAAQLDFSDIYVIVAIARGTLVFNDGVNTLLGFLACPTVAQMIQNWNQQNNDNVPGSDNVPDQYPGQIEG